MRYGEGSTGRFYRLVQDMNIPKLCLYRFNTQTVEDVKRVFGLLQGRPLLDTRPIRLEMRFPERVAQDIALASDADVAILSARGAQLFERMAGADIQLIPAIIEGREGFSVVNVKTKIDCIDWDRSTASYDKNNKPTSIIDAVIFKDRLGSASMIRVLPTFIIVSDLLRRSILDVGLTGADFLPLKSRND